MVSIGLRRRPPRVRCRRSTRAVLLGGSPEKTFDSWSGLRRLEPVRLEERRRRPGSPRSARRPRPPRRPSRRSAGTPPRRAACRGWRRASSGPARAAGAMSSRRPRGSRPADGSSNTRIEGSIDSTVARATRFRCPRDRRCGTRCSKPAMPTAASARSTRPVHLVGRQAHVERPEGDVIEHRRAEQLVVGVLEDEAHLGADAADRRRSTAMPATSTDPCAGRSVPLSWSISVLLPAPFGPTSATFSPARCAGRRRSSASKPSG